MKKLLTLFLSTLLTISSCAGTRQLLWDPPLADEDGAPIVSELVYVVYSLGSGTNRTPLATTTNLTVPVTTTGKKTLAVTAAFVEEPVWSESPLSNSTNVNFSKSGPPVKFGKTP